MRTNKTVLVLLVLALGAIAVACGSSSSGSTPSPTPLTVATTVVPPVPSPTETPISVETPTASPPTPLPTETMVTESPTLVPIVVPTAETVSPTLVPEETPTGTPVSEEMCAGPPISSGGPECRPTEEIFRGIPPLDPGLKTEEVMSHVRTYFPELGVRTEHASQITPEVGYPTEPPPDFAVQIWKPLTKEAFLVWRAEIEAAFQAYLGAYYPEICVWYTPVDPENMRIIETLGLSEEDRRTYACANSGASLTPVPTS